MIARHQAHPWSYGPEQCEACLADSRNSVWRRRVSEAIQVLSFLVLCACVVAFVWYLQAGGQ